MIRVSLILLLVSVLGSHGISVLDTSYGSRKFTDPPLKGDNKSSIDISKGDSLVKQESSTEVTTVSQQDDQDPSESSETVVYNRFEKPSNDDEKTAHEEEEEEDPEGPPDHVIPQSEHEEARNVATKPKYTAPGEWAKPPKDKEVNLEFVPSKVYAQVRKTHTLRRLPRKKAIENAESEEEKENAARLREVVKNSKVNTVYTEEGYEDSAYDHAGHIRDADFDERYDRKLRDRLDLRKKSKDDDGDDFDEEENETRQRNYEKVRPEEFKDFDEDYSDAYETSRDYGSISDTVRGDGKWKMVNPRVVAEQGTEKLQEDLEREAVEIEKGFEIGKLEKVETTTDGETLAESQRSDGYDKRNDLRWRKERQRKKPSSLTRNGEDPDGNSREKLKRYRALQNSRNSSADSVDRAIESSTSRGRLGQDSSGSHKYEANGNSLPNIAPVDVRNVEEYPTTVSYSQLFWDYFKMQQNQLSTTEAPVTSEPTTLNPHNFLQGSSFMENANNLVPHSVYGQEITMAFPIIEPVILGQQQIIPIGQTLIDPVYSKNNAQSSQLIPLGVANINDIWQPITSNGAATTEPVQYSEQYLNSQKNLGSNDSPTFDPTLNPFNRKPRYKITIRHKPKKPTESSESLSQESVTTSPMIEPLIESTTPVAVPINENYMKVLLHLRNEKNAKNRYHPNDLQRTNFFPSSSKNELEDLTRLRPPLPQKASDYYYDFSPRSQPEIDATKSDWSPLPVHRKLQPIPRSNPRKPLIQSDSSHAKQGSHVQQRLPFHRKRNASPPLELVPPAAFLRNDMIRHKEPIDYANRGGSGSRHGRNVLRPFRQTIGLDGVRGIRVKRRERRSARGQVDYEGIDVVKGSIASNGTSNRGEIERAASDPSIERNCSQKVTRGVEVGLVLDTSRAKQLGEKKSRSCANDRGEESRATERESSVDGLNGNEGRNGGMNGDLGAFEYDDGKKGEGNVAETARTTKSSRGMGSKMKDELEERGESVFKNNVPKKEEGNIVESKRTTRNSEEANFRVDDKSKRPDKLLAEAPKIVNAEINARFNWGEEKEEGEEDKESKGHGEFLDLKVPRNDAAIKGKENLAKSKRTKRNAEEANSKMNDKLKQHDKLLEEAPKITEDVVQKEINTRFGEDEKKDQGEEDNEKKVEVEVPEFDYVEDIIEEDQAGEDIATTEVSLDLEKYPFYADENLPMPSALKYATDPGRLPRKTYGGMEFYTSRDAYKHCDEVEPNLEVLPEKEEPAAERGPNENSPRLRGLGDKLDCFKAKYFDNNPFDNPLFFEKEVKGPRAPAELDTKQFASRIMMFPKENDDFVIQRSSKRPENYRQSRKPISVRYQTTRRIRYKNYPTTRTRTRPKKRPPVYGAQVPQVKNKMVSRKPQNTSKNAATSASEVSSFYMPYQNQVYEDVMGTIKNLASSQLAQEVTTTPSSEETTVVNEIDDDVKTNSSASSTSYGKKVKNKVQIDITDQPNDVGINIKGTTRPKNRNRHRPLYKRTRRPQMNKPRIHMMQTPVVAVRTVKHRQRIRVYKRELRDANESREKKWPQSSDELDSTKNSKDETRKHLNSEDSHNQHRDSENIGNSKISTSRVNPKIQDIQKFPGRKDSTTPSVTSRREKRKTKVLKSVRRIGASNADADQENQKSEKVVYTVKDRIRYSKSKPDSRRVGKFVNETNVEEDFRRGEPKYNFIRRKNSSDTVPTTTESSLPSTTAAINWSETVTTTGKIIEVEKPEFEVEDRAAKYLVEETRSESSNASVNFSDAKQAIETPKEEIANKTGGGYAVYENVNEGEPTTTQKPQSPNPSEFFSLKTFLEIDPPGYMELSSEDFKKPFFSNNNSSGDFDINLDTPNSNATVKEKDEASLKSFRPSYFSSGEESSEKAETKTKVRSSTESSEESSAPSKENESVEDRTFFSYTPRPYSPAENYEDQKYSELGPRVNKPAFVHPPFSFNKYRKSRSRASSEEIAESDERKEEYAFPWQKDKEDQRKKRRSRSRGKSTGEYEYPWERRERLAREEKRRKEDKRKRLGKSFDDDDDDEDVEETSLVKQQRNIYPRGRYRYWSRKDRDASEDNAPDNTESSSEYQPTTRYSSRYNSKNSKLPLNDKSTSVGSRSVEEISRSIKKALEGDSEEKGTSREKEDDSSWEKKSTFSYRPRSISRGIVPEDVTVAPSRRTGKRWQSKDNDSKDTTSENRNSNATRNSLDDSETRVTVVKTNPREIINSTNELNSTRQPSKKRRRPSKNAAATVESTTVSNTEAGRARRRQKSASTTSAAIIGTTSAPRVIRRRNHKTQTETKKDSISKAPNKSNDDPRNEAEMSKSGTVEHRTRSRKKNRNNEIINEPTKSEEERVRSTNSSMKKERGEKVNDDRERKPEYETTDEISINDYASKNEETTDSKGEYPSVKSEERYDYKDDRTVALNDSDRSDRAYDDDDYDFGSVAETDESFTPQNGALQLSELGSKELVTSASWTSENYDF